MDITATGYSARANETAAQSRSDERAGCTRERILHFIMSAFPEVLTPVAVTAALSRSLVTMMA